MLVLVVNVTGFMMFGASSSHPHAPTDDAFNTLFTEDDPVYFNYRSYASELKELLFGRHNTQRVTIASYN